MAVFKSKHKIFSLILVCLIVVSPMTEAQLGLGDTLKGVGDLVSDLGNSLAGLGNNIIDRTVRDLPDMGLRLVDGLIGGIVDKITGVIFCSTNGAPNGTSTPVFANARVQLQCGRQNRVVSTTTTNAAGSFLLPTTRLPLSLSTLLSDCSVVVATPLSTCNAALPSVGSLVSGLTMARSSVPGMLSIILGGFDFLN